MKSPVPVVPPDGIEVNGVLDRPSCVTAPVALSTYQTLLLSVKFRFAIVDAGPVLPAPVLLDAVYVQAALVAFTFGVKMKWPLLSGAESVPPEEQLAPVT